jgi:hypothetical protein
MIVESWLAFETLAGDLWEAALNANPAWARTFGSVSLEEMHNLSQGTYDLRGKMGTLLRGRFQFCGLRGIREAYAAAFQREISAIDEVLAVPSLDSLAHARAQFLHHAGTIDESAASRFTAPVVDIASRLLEAVDAAIGNLKLKADS